MSDSSVVRERILGGLKQFLRTTGRESPVIVDRTNLMNDLGLSSDEGIDFVLDLCDRFSVEFPMDFNPFVHENGRRGRRFGEMVRAVELHLASLEVTA
jgi:hypothetical protein